MEALVIDTKVWYEDANTNLRSLKRDVGQYITESVSYEKTMWERIETELEEINVKSLGFNHPICSACKEFIRNEESKINMDDDLGNINYGEWGEEGSSASATRKSSHKIARRADYIMVAQLEKKAELEIVYLETGRPNSSQDKRIIHISLYQFLGDIIELYAMRKESDIYKYCLIEKVTIPLHMTSLSAVYPLIHALMTLRIAIACTIHKILYSSDSGDSEHSSSEMVVTVSTPKNS
ncbi:hypothetical protein C1646_795274 [Rhizophagus diaphanus]|nr:hypothetical protein C1646_795274 [Rhizophagus diaphanus] [Rhizophagus sp. MUCL 43196]